MRRTAILISLTVAVCLPLATPAFAEKKKPPPPPPPKELLVYQMTEVFISSY